MVTVALAKGKLLGPTLALLKRAGYASEAVTAESRRLVFADPDAGTTLLIVRPSDVPTYVEYGGADVGVVGKDVLLEQDRDVYEPLDLNVGYCRIVVAALKGQERQDRLSARIRVATKYPNVTERFFNQKGIPAEIIKLYGSVELAPVVGLADCIVDLVSTGRTLREHNLVEVEVIAESTARLIVNRASLKMKHGPIMDLITQLQGHAVRARRRAPESRGGRP